MTTTTTTTITMNTTILLLVVPTRYACLVLYNIRLLSSHDKTTIKYYIRTPVVTVWWAVCVSDYSDCSRVFLSLDLR